MEESINNNQHWQTVTYEFKNRPQHYPPQQDQIYKQFSNTISESEEAAQKLLWRKRKKIFLNEFLPKYITFGRINTQYHQRCESKRWDTEANRLFLLGRIRRILFIELKNFLRISLPRQKSGGRYCHFWTHYKNTALLFGLYLRLGNSGQWYDFKHKINRVRQTKLRRNLDGLWVQEEEKKKGEKKKEKKRCNLSITRKDS